MQSSTIITKHYNETNYREKTTSEYLHHKLSRNCDLSLFFILPSDVKMLVPEIIKNDTFTINEVDETDRYLLFTYEIKWTPFRLPLTFYEFASFSLHLVHAITLLHKENLICFQFQPSNVVSVINSYDTQYPRIKSFELSHLFTKYEEQNITELVTLICDPNANFDFLYKPIEVHLIYFLIKNDLNTVSFSQSYEFVNRFTQQITDAGLIHKNDIPKFQKDCEGFVYSFINTSRKQIIERICVKNNVFTWDTYGVSVLCLLIMRNLNLKNDILSELFHRNICPYPNRRENLTIETLREGVLMSACSTSSTSTN